MRVISQNIGIVHWQNAVVFSFDFSSQFILISVACSRKIANKKLEKYNYSWGHLDMAYHLMDGLSHLFVRFPLSMDLKMIILGAMVMKQADLKMS